MVLPLHPPSCFFVLFVVQTLLGLRFCTFVSIRVHSWFSLFHIPRVISCISCFSWFKHCLDYVFVHLCPFVSIRDSPSSPSFVFFRVPFVTIRGSPSSPSFVFFRVFRAFRGSNTAWTTFLHIRVHSCPFVVQASIWTTFVSIRVHSWFSLFPLLRVFSCFSCFSWFKPVYGLRSCPFVVLPLPLLRVFRAFRVFRGSNTAWTTFLHIRVHSCPFVVQASIWTTFVSIRVHSWFSLFPLLRVFLVYFVLFVVQTLLGLCFCPFVSIRGSPSSPSFVFFRAFRVFRGLILPFPFSLLF